MTAEAAALSHAPEAEARRAPDARVRAPLRMGFRTLFVQERINERLQWTLSGESYLWAPELQRSKRNKPDVLTYEYARKRREVAWFQQTQEEQLPYCPVQYIS